MRRLNGIAKTGLDLTLAPLQRLRKLDVHVVNSDITQGLPFHDSSFDLILCSEVIEHEFDTDNLMTECYRCLEVGGRVLITTPNINNWCNRIRIPLGLYPTLSMGSLASVAL